MPRDDLSKAVGLNSVNANLARLVGPVLAGVIILHWPIIWIFVLNGAVTILFVTLLLRLKVSPPPAPAARQVFHAEVTEGIGHVWCTPAVRLILLSMFCGGALVCAAVELIPAIAAKSFGEDVALPC
ncbi:MFS transporter [Frigidibacter sp. ROC022]|uniref:MFS transporter n=1 Tax=Frigidibacter sp. ROC022 TaxID=2971796 RepID=UPI00215B72E6|nr:MFS transporter [Frigidibacter sp. ROC022]